MTTGYKANPPPQFRTPQAFNQDPDTRAFFEQIRQILFQLWRRTGGGSDDLYNLIYKEAQTITSDAALTSTGQLVLIDASGGDVTLTLPEITSVNNGASVGVCLISATGNGYIACATGDNILGDGSILLNEQFMSFDLRATSNGWVSAG